MTQDCPEVTRYLHEHIPLTAAMQVEVTNLSDDTVTLFAPLAPNINHRDTVFGGSASSLAIMSAWTLLHLKLRAFGLEVRIVIHRSAMEYSKPIVADFTSTSTFRSAADWPQFRKLLDRRGKARVEMQSILTCQGVEVGTFSGHYVAMKV